MRASATIMASVLALSVLGVGASAQTPDFGLAKDASSAETPSEQIPGAETPVLLVEYERPILTQSPQPPSRPGRISEARPRQAAPTIRPAAAVQPQRVAFDPKPRSPLFWMTVGVGF